MEADGSDETGASYLSCGTAAQDRDHRANSDTVSRLWQHVAAAWGGRLGDSGIRSAAMQSDPHAATETELRGLLADRTGEQALNRAINRGLAGAGLLAHVLVAKYADHLPLYRQVGDLPVEATARR
jgi:hypothetical protein